MSMPTVVNQSLQFGAKVSVDEKALKTVQKKEDYAPRLKEATEEALKGTVLENNDAVELTFTTVPKLKIIGPVKIGGKLGQAVGWVDEKTNDAKEAAQQKADESGLSDKIPDFPGRGFLVKLGKGRVAKKVVTKFPAVKAAQLLTHAHNDECLSVSYPNSEGQMEQEVVEKDRKKWLPEEWAAKAVEHALRIFEENNAQ